jgi:hypothetical protein
MGLLLEVSASRLLRLFMKCTPRYLHRNKRVVSALSHLRRPGGILRLSALSLSLLFYDTQTQTTWRASAPPETGASCLRDQVSARRCMYACDFVGQLTDSDQGLCKISATHHFFVFLLSCGIEFTNSFSTTPLLCLARDYTVATLYASKATSLSSTHFKPVTRSTTKSSPSITTSAPSNSFCPVLPV